MSWGRLRGAQYVRLAPGASEAVSPYVGVPADGIDELLIELWAWPERVRPAPVRGWDGRLIPGDPVLVGADDSGLVFAARGTAVDVVVVGWEQVREMHVVGRWRETAGA